MVKSKSIKTKSRSTNESIFQVFTFIVSLLLLLIIWSQRYNLAHLSQFGYLGIFIINFVSSATVLFPVPGVASVFVGGAIWNPVLVGLVSGIGAALGEMLGYLLGYGGRGLLKSWEKKRWFSKTQYYFHKRGFLTVFVFAMIPLPFFDVIGLLAGALNYPIWKFGAATLVGRVLRNFLIAWTGAKFL